MMSRLPGGNFKKSYFIFFSNYFPLQVAGYIQELLQQSGLKLNLGLVQTAYANGSSTNYITQSLVSRFIFSFVS